MQRLSTFLVSVALAGPIVTSASRADAFCRTMTGRDPSDPTVKGNKCDSWNAAVEGSCCPYGKPLYWKNACVGFSLQKDASNQVSLNDAEQALITAFNKWTGTSCPTDGVGPSRVSIDVRYLGPVNCGTVKFNDNGPNQHVIVFRDGEWNHVDSNNTLGLTSVQYNPQTGEILDADMELNTAQQTLTVRDPIPPAGYDLASIVTHEAGHFLGLAHSLDDHATMYAQYRPGSTHMRNLTPDDVSGICGSYLPNGQRGNSDPPVEALACDPTPAGGYTLECGGESSKGCAVSSFSSFSRAGSDSPETASQDDRSASFAVAMASFLAVGLVVTRRRAPRRA
ncbi:matrixin family metalloprotease [Pendulispora rubella]|uniref:Matrixin family metalloprotease n=1 Tax=Pendulispora rubella TaxID=2741070 RepID=A0ABZ2LAY0_9BACT